jgi:hypothetical protein
LRLPKGTRKQRLQKIFPQASVVLHEKPVQAISAILNDFDECSAGSHRHKQLFQPLFVKAALKFLGMPFAAMT